MFSDEREARLQGLKPFFLWGFSAGLKPRPSYSG